MGEVKREILAELREACRVPGTGNPRPKSPLYSVVLPTLPVLIRLMFRIHYRGLHRLPRKGAVILAANHTSHIDPFTIISGARRRTYYLSKDEHFEKWYTAIVMNTTGQIRTHRESGAAGALSSGSDVLGAGLAMGIFSTSQFLGTFFGGAVGGLIYNIYDLNSVFLLTIFVAIIWWFVMITLPHTTKTSEE